ncbi:calcineurin-binding protein cabin-1-like [Phymastichus coffea]|uniref:calcineurin-binding protein cabin-1-like n=1 Tax=Phymastichus coffea TaxID=108790 RepID=UPI00273C667F|nr:calcineurin-binding protein cabin-1-like [Phymastichus coffea]
MLKITALNEVQSKETEEDNVNAITKEAQEQFALNEYNRALQLLIENNKTEALNVLLELLDTKLLDEVKKPKKQDGHTRPMLSLKYACYKNIANIQADLENYHEAVTNYWQAINLDDSDVMIWYKIGTLALNKSNLEEACFAFRQGLKRNKNHWPCLDSLITVLYAIPDYMNCLMYISLALERDPSYSKGLIFCREILKVVPSFEKLSDDFFEFPLDSKYDQNIAKVLLKKVRKLSEDWISLRKSDKSPLRQLCLEKPLESLSWLELGEKLMLMIKYMNENNLNLLNYIVLADSNQLETLVSVCNSHKEIEIHESTHQKENSFSDTKQIFSSTENNELDNENQTYSSEFRITEKINCTDDSPIDSCDESQIKVETNGCVEKFNSEDKDEENIMNEDCKLNEKSIDDSLDPSKGDPNLNSRETQRQKKVKKRRRSSLCILTEWHWSSSNTKRSSRISNRKDCEKDGIEETLKQIFPPALLPDNIKFSKEDAIKNNDSMDTMDAYYAMLNKESNFTEDSKSMESFKANSPSNEGQISYFGMEQEYLDVREFITKYSGKCNMITLTTKFIQFLCTKWNQKWPSELAELYIQMYLYVKKYTPLSSPLDDKTDDEYLLKLSAEVKILYCELLLDKWLLKRASTLPEESSEEKLETEVALLSDDLGYIVFSRNDDDLSDVYLLRRMLWLKANLFLYQGNVELSLRIFELLLCHFQESQIDLYIKLNNCTYNATISADTVQKTITLIKRSKKFSKIRRLYEDKNYEEVSSILKDTFHFTKQINEFLMYKGKSIDRIEHFKLLLDSLWQLHQYEDCYVWAEACFNESWHNYLNTIGIDLQSVENEEEKKKWVDSILYTLKMLDDCVSEVSIFVVQYLKESRRSRFLKNLIHFVSHQLETLDSTSTIPIFSVLPWILLHYILQYEEDRQRARSMSRQKHRSDIPSSPESDENEYEIPASVILLFKAHTFLGRHGWCCVEEGRLLIFIIKLIIPKINFPLFAKIKNKLIKPLEQVIFCLYGHPAKYATGQKQRSKHLEDHTTQHMSCTWEICQVLIEFYKPETLPNYDSKKTDSINSETLDLFKKMCCLVPKESSSIDIIKEMNAYLHGNRMDIPKVKVPLPSQVSYLYYYIADYYFKNIGNLSWLKASKYYIYDLCQHPNEFNSWAGLAMSIGTIMETWLNNFEPNISEEKYLEKAKIAQLSYQHAVDLEPTHLIIWTEYGNFLYTVHSFCSRLLKQESDSLNMKRFEVLENQKDEMINKAKECFATADDISNNRQGTDEPNEKWLYQYMLGKVAEKKNKEPQTFLKYYLQAGKWLLCDNDSKPKSTPQWSHESLEVYYRIFASILKYLEQHEGKPLKKSLFIILHESLKNCLKYPFMSYDCTFYKMPVDQLVSSTKNRLQDQCTNRKSNTSLKRRNDVFSSANDERIKRARYNESDLKKDVGSLVNDLIMEVCNQLSPKREPSEHCPVIKFASSSMIMDTDMRTEVDVQVPKTSYTEDSPAANIDDADKKSIAEVEDAPKDIPKKMQDELKKCNKSDKILNRRDSQESSTTTETSTSETNDTSSSSENSSSSSDSSSNSSSSSESDSDSVSSDAEKKGQPAVSENTFATEKEVSELIEMCLAGLEQCILKFPKHYKSVYRLAYFHFNNKTFKNIAACKQLLLGTYECRFHPNQKIQGLFADRKNNNFFNGIWRIPVQEIDRPGSFASYMSRCTSFLMQILKDSGDSRMLTELCIQLRRKPEAEKKYLRDNEREQLACQALTMCIQCLRNKIKFNNNDKSSLYGLNIEAKLQVLLDIFYTYQMIKNISDYEMTSLPQVKKLLEEGYISYCGNPKVQGNIFEIAVDCCRQQNRLKNRVSTPNVNTSVHPTITPSTSSLTVTPVTKMPSTAPRKSQKSTGPPKVRGRPPTFDKQFPNMSRTNFKSTSNEMNANQMNANLPFTGNPGVDPLLSNLFLRPDLLAYDFSKFSSNVVFEAMQQYINRQMNLNSTSGLNYNNPQPFNNPKPFNNPPPTNVQSEKASTSSTNNMFGSMKARPDVSITPVTKNPLPKFSQSGTKTKTSRPNDSAPSSTASKVTNLMTPPEISLLKPSQAHQQQRSSEHGLLNQVALNLLNTDNNSASRNSIFPSTSQTSITPVKSIPPMSRAQQLNAPLPHPRLTSIDPVKPPTSLSQQTTSLQHKLLHNKHHNQSYHSSVITSMLSRKEEPMKPYYSSSRKSALGDPNDLSMLSNLATVNPLQTEMLHLGTATSYTTKKSTQSSKVSKRSIPNVNNPTTYSIVHNPVGYSHKKTLQDLSISSATGYSTKPSAQDLNNPAAFTHKKLAQDTVNISPGYSMKKPGPDISGPVGLSLKKSMQDIHNPASYSMKKKPPEAHSPVGYSMKKPIQDVNSLTGISLKKAPQDINNQYSNPVLNRLQQQSHLEIIPQSSRPRQVEPMNAPVEFSAVNNQSKPMNFMSSDSVSVYELPKQKPNVSNSSPASASRAEKELVGSKVEIITLDD